MSGDDIDARLARLAMQKDAAESFSGYGQPARLYDDVWNNDTFDVDVQSVQNDFDFGASARVNVVQAAPTETSAIEQVLSRLEAKRSISDYTLPLQSQSHSYHNQPMSLQEIEAQMFAQHQLQQQQMQYISPAMPMSMPYPTTLEQLEEMMLMQQFQLKQQHQQHHQQQQQHHTVHRNIRESHTQQLAHFNGIMTQFEKDQIARIQISQLVSADPLADDFYYQVYTVLRGTNPNEQQLLSGVPPLILRNAYQRRGFRNREQRDNRDKPQTLQDQIQRIVNHAKKRPKATQLSLEGALGKISLTSVKNPRQVLQVSPSTVSMDVKPQLSSSPSTMSIDVKPQLSVSRTTLRELLKQAEQLYSLVIKLEELKHKPPQPSPTCTPVNSNNNNSTNNNNNNTTTTTTTTNNNSNNSNNDESLPVDPVAVWEQANNDALSDILDIIKLSHLANHGVHPFIQLMYVCKGKKLVPRLARLLSSDLCLSLYLLIFTHAHTLDVVRNASTPALFAAPQLFPSLSVNKPTLQQLLLFVEELETFMTAVVPVMVGFVADASFDTVCMCMEALLDKNRNMIRLASSKVGLALLTMLLSRAEILKQTFMSEADIARWTHIYNHLFGELQGHYLAFFPLTSIPNIPDDVGPTFTSVQALESYLADDVHVWQFLASLAVGANAEQQHMLVAEVRDRILRNVASGLRMTAGEDSGIDKTQDKGDDEQRERRKRSIANVNLFLHALGLDASQIRT